VKSFNLCVGNVSVDLTCVDLILQNAAILDCNKRKLNRHVWTLDDYRHYLPHGLVSHEEILTTHIVSFPHFLVLNLLNL